MSKTRLNPKKKSQTDVVITGVGIVSSIAKDISTFNKILQNGTTGITASNKFKNLSFPLIAAELKDFSFENCLNKFTDLPNNLLENVKRVGLRAPLVIQTSIIAALEAWYWAQLYKRKISLNRIGLVVAGNNTTQAYQNNLHTSFQEEPSYLSPSYALHFMDTDQVGTISQLLGIQGEGFTVGGASASGNLGLIHGYRLIQKNYVDVCVVIGVLADLSPKEIQGFYNIGAMGGKNFKDTPDKACRPFDELHEGFIWGQASGCLILESARTSKNKDITPLVSIIGMAMNLDGNRTSEPSLQGEVRAMQQALRSAELEPYEVDYINAHGSSSPLGDKTEIAAIKEVFRDAVSKIWLNSTKSITGHCLWSAGIVEAISTILQLQENYLHPNLNLDAPIDNLCRFVGSRAENVPIQVAMSNSFGFGGINSSVIFSKGVIR